MKIDWKHIFNWSVESVSEPYLVHLRELYVPVYAVDVKYVYHGTRREVFVVDTLGTFGRKTSYAMARRYFEFKKKQIAAQKTK